MAALYVLRWQLSSMVDAIGGDLVSKCDTSSRGWIEGPACLSVIQPRFSQVRVDAGSRSRTVGRHCHLRPAPAALHRRLGERGESASLKVASEQEPSISRFPPVSPQVLLHLGVMQQVSRAHACLNIARRALTMCAHSLLRRRLRRKRRRRRAMT